MSAGESQNVVVASRVRPLDLTEAKIGARSVVRCQHNKTIIVDPTYPTSEKAFAFDYSFWSGEPGSDALYASQSDLYHEIGHPMLVHAFEGFNVCIFSYGQTNAGKTYTMMGPAEDVGIIPRFCEELFSTIVENSSTAPEVSFKVELSYFEIYNEKVRCLLNPDTHKKELRVREHPITGPFVEDLTRYIVEDYDDIFKWITTGNQARTVSQTKFNQSSSRSHAVFTLILTQNKMTEEGQCTEVVSKINLVDLAGSERCGQAAGSVSSDAFKEGVTINKSLSTLGRVIHALSEQSRSTDQVDDPQDDPHERARKRRQWVGYRDSVLTWLLKENLGGNSKTIMLANISPASTNYEESLNTLRYAERVKFIRNEAVINEDHGSQLIRELKQEIHCLRRQLYSAAGQPCPSPGRRLSGSYSNVGANGMDDGENDWKSKLEMSEQIIAEINQSWQDRLCHSQNVFNMKLAQVEREIMAKANAMSYAIEDLPILINLNPHPVANEQLAHVLRPGETYLGTDDEPITDETKDDIRLADGFNLSNPHCIFEHHDTGEVEMIPLNGSLSYVNGQLLTTTFILTHGCRIVLGSNHVFLFVDPIHSQAFREHKKAQGGGLPRIIDWSYVSREFASSMGILCKQEQISGLWEDINQMRDENAALKESNDATVSELQALRTSPFIVLINDRPDAASVRRLYWHLQPGRNSIGFGGTVCPQGVQQMVILDYTAKSGHVCLLTGQKTLSNPLPHGYRFQTGTCSFQLLLPPEEKAADGSKDGKPLRGSATTTHTRMGMSPPKRGSVLETSSTKKADAGGSKSSAAHSIAEDPFFEDIKQKLYDFQFAVLNMRDQLFPPPPDTPAVGPDGEPLAAPALSPEEEELQEKRRVLRDDWLLTSKKPMPPDILDHMTYLQHELRYLTFVSAQREQLVDQLQYAVEHGQREESEAEIGRLQEELSRMQETAMTMREQLEQLQHSGASSRASPRAPDSSDRRKDEMIAQLQAQVKSLEQKVAEASDPWSTENEFVCITQDRSDNAAQMDLTKTQVREVQAKLESITAAHDSLVESYNTLLRKQNRLDTEGPGTGTDILNEELQIMNRKLQASETRCAQLQQKLEGRTQDYDTLYYTHQKLKEDMEVQRQQLHDANNRLRSDLEDSRANAKKSKADQELQLLAAAAGVSSASISNSLPRDSIKAFNKMKDTIKLLTKVAKSKDDKISLLEKDMQSKNELMMTLNNRLMDRTTPGFPGGAETLGSQAPGKLLLGENQDIPQVALDQFHSMRVNMDYVMQQLKAEVIHLSRNGLAQLDKIVSSAGRGGSGGVEIFKKAHQFVHKVVADIVGESGLQAEVWPITSADIEKIKTHHRSSFVKALREMVICYDLHPDYIKGGLVTHDDLVRNLSTLVKMAQFCMCHERMRGDVSPNRSSASEVGGRKQKRSSSASSNRSSNATSVTSSSSVQSSVAKPYSSISSRIAAYISPKRQGPSSSTTTTTAPTASSTVSSTRHVSPRPGLSSTISSTPTTSSLSSKSRALSPRPGTTTTTRTKIKSPSPSPDAAAARRHQQDALMRANSPFGTITKEGTVRSTTPKTATTKKTVTSSSPAVVAVDFRSVYGQPPDPYQYMDQASLDRPGLPPTAPRSALFGYKSPSVDLSLPLSPGYSTASVPTTVSDLRQQVRPRSPHL
uniref:Kinesin motor domain-containing protein n=1 Tax=Eutreptiella gymnastica TaxID=73025 RepID=A0A7S1JCJ0_9EUGL|mmetsp:Transcript_81656/g.144019  ORF Transcript_81656/g.144019 Transcript_81656/m.144019 type:complete len:1667 (+) Transcript_81656:81-5081(+)